MKLSRNFRILTASAALATLAACSGGAGDDEGDGEEAVAAEEASGPAASVKERQAKFEAIGDAFKAIRGQLETDSPDMALIGESAAIMNQNAEAVAELFPAGTSVDDGVETEALAAIWEKPEEFEAARVKLVETSAEMAALAQGGDAAAVGAQVAAVGGSCKGCHENFRLKTE